MSMETYPENLGQNVHITLVDGTQTDGYWDGLQWWVGIENDGNDLPIDNAFVASWQQFT